MTKTESMRPVLSRREVSSFITKLEWVESFHNYLLWIIIYLRLTRILLYDHKYLFCGYLYGTYHFYVMAICISRFFYGLLCHHKSSRCLSFWLPSESVLRLPSESVLRLPLHGTISGFMLSLCKILIVIVAVTLLPGASFCVFNYNYTEPVFSRLPCYY